MRPALLGGRLVEAAPGTGAESERAPAGIGSAWPPRSTRPRRLEDALLRQVAENVKDVTRAEDELRRSHARLRALTARREAVREEERTRVARDIHDQLGQALTGLKLDLLWIADTLPLPPRPLRTRLRSLARSVDSAIGAVRTIAAALRPAPLDHLGLVAALEWQARQFQVLSGLRVDLDVTLHDEGLAPEIATAAFRVFQEALTNVARHARAARVEVRLTEAGERLALDVRDDGRGITDAEREDPESLGLLGMQERARMLSGELEVGRHPEGGTVVALRLPIRRTAPSP